MRAGGDGDEARLALGELCEAYWNPVFRFLRREGHGDEEARELTQEFFARLLAGGGVSAADRLRGRFRSFLLGAVRHFLADVRDHRLRLKRGGGIERLPLDAFGTVETESGMKPGDVPMAPGPSDATFDRQWAVTVMNRALARLEVEYRDSGRGALFDSLRVWLGGDGGVEGQVDAGRRLGLSEGAVRVAVHRLRMRFREWIRREVSQTVPEFSEVDAELRYLVEVLSTTGSSEVSGGSSAEF